MPVVVVFIYSYCLNGIGYRNRYFSRRIAKPANPCVPMHACHIQCDAKPIKVYYIARPLAEVSDVSCGLICISYLTDCIDACHIMLFCTAV